MLCMNRSGNRQIGLFAQADGSGQKFHIHAFVNSPDLTTGKLIDGRLKSTNARRCKRSDEQTNTSAI